MLMHPSTSLTVWMPSTALEVGLGPVSVDVWDLPVLDVLPEHIGATTTAQSVKCPYQQLGLEVWLRLRLR